MTVGIDTWLPYLQLLFVVCFELAFPFCPGRTIQCSSLLPMHLGLAGPEPPVSALVTHSCLPWGPWPERSDKRLPGLHVPVVRAAVVAQGDRRDRPQEHR